MWRNATLAVVHEQRRRAGGLEALSIRIDCGRAGAASVRLSSGLSRRYLRVQVYRICAAGCSAPTAGSGLLKVFVVDRGAET